MPVGMPCFASSSIILLVDTATDNPENTAQNTAVQNAAIAAQVPADALFTIVPNSDYSGYTISAQGL